MHPFFKSFHYALKGIQHGFSAERNMKFHCIAALGVIFGGVLTGLSKLEWLTIIILIGGMIALELMNTAIERTVDLVTDDFHPLAKQAKDLASGAVLVFAICSAIIAMIIFIPKWL
ncbi:diacylglycerol kinase family protein [Sporosarcina highlanderae]|uniref:Diacylglycerol kinase family protein n=1 Tax=Sporosarcina highlanderae TaxID=3035916 RepID=A0ABT8JR80_9BACL|nr:diacylglycerol kinase family protein [Sporosarcina highlanderae]MDN4607051.1 diacylglycerol kinase family protein [Sporosarcina highlanderae]